MSGEYLAETVIVSVGTGPFTGKQLQAAFLTEYDESSDTYVGVIFPHSEEFTQLLHATGKGTFTTDTPLNLGVVVRIPGLRRYPYRERPNADFQFVLKGEDPAPLRAIMAANAEGKYTTAPVEQVEQVEQAQQQGNYDPADLNKDGTVTKKERKRYENR